MSLYPFLLLAAAASSKRRVRVRAGNEYRHTVEWQGLDDRTFAKIRKMYASTVWVVSRVGTTAVIQFDHVAESDFDWELPERWTSASGIFVQGDTPARFRLVDVRAPES